MQRRDRIRIYHGLTHERLLRIWREDQAAWLLDRAAFLFMDTPTMDQHSFRFRNDDGTEATATWKAAENVDITENADSDVTLRVRVQVDETAGNASNNYTPQLQRRLNAGAYGIVNGASTIVTAQAVQLVDGNDTTQQLGAGTFVSPNAGQDDVNGHAGSAVCDYVGSDECEFEYGIRVISADVNDGDTVDVRVSDGDIDNYTVTHGRITIEKTAPSGRIMSSLVGAGGLVSSGGIAGPGGGLAG